VVAMIALPVLCLSFAAVSYDMFTLTGQERADQTMGKADARIRWSTRDAVEQDTTGSFWPARTSTNPGPGGANVTVPAKGGSQSEPKPATEAELLAKLPAGSKALPLRTGPVDLKTADGVGQPNAISVDATDPLTAGYVKVLQGRAPQTPYEAALTKQASLRLGQGLGGKITSTDGLRSYSVVGLVEFPSLLEQAVLFAPIAEENPKGFQLFDRSWLVHTPTPVSWAEVRTYNESGMTIASREVFVNPPPAQEVPSQYTAGLRPQELAVGVIVAGLALLEIVLLAGPAFAVSARRRQRQLALVAANGGTPAHVRRIVLADGVVLGVVGAFAGIVLGIGAAFLARPFVEDLLAHSRAGGYRVFPTALLTIAVLAVVTGVLAALVPAFVTARQNVISSLAGRRGATRSKKRWIVLGVVMVAVGSASVLSGSFAISAWVMLAGLVVGELGLVLCTPALVGLIARLGRLLPLAPRIALRDAARNRAAAAPAISAVMAAVAGSVAIGLYLDSDVAQQKATYQASAPLGTVTIFLPGLSDDPAAPKPASRAAIESTLHSTLPVLDIRPVQGFGCASSANEPQMCDLRMELPTDLICPYLQVLQTGARAVTAAEQRAAKTDPRCAEATLWNQYAATVDDGSALALLTGASAADVSAATAVLRAGGVVVTDARYIRDGKTTFAVINTNPTNGKDPSFGAPRMSFPAYLLTTGVRGAMPIVSPGAIAKAGFTMRADSRLIASTSRMPTQAEDDRFQQQLRNLGVGGGGIERGPGTQIPVDLWIIMAAAALITLGAAGIGTGLAAADGRADLSTLAAVGASPRLRRGLSLSQSTVIAGLGSVLGAAAGLGAGIAVLVALNQRYADIWPGRTPTPIAIPWLSLTAALFVVPFVAILGAGMLTRSHLPIERRI
jgi:putative ABC transport system permease protein